MSENKTTDEDHTVKPECDQPVVKAASGRQLKITALVCEAYGCLSAGNTKEAINLLARCKKVMGV